MTYNPANVGVPAVARSAAKLATNNTGNTVYKATPARISISGIESIDVSNEAEANAIAGIVRSDISDANEGEIVSAGLLENITTSAAIGDIMYVSKVGDLTNIKPSIGVNGFVSGDWIIRVGVIAKNSSNPVLKDLLVNIQIIGEL